MYKPCFRNKSCNQCDVFFRRQMEFSPDEIEAMVLYQVSVVAGFARSLGGELVHVKPHGAMYNHAAKDITSARAIARGVSRFSKGIILVGLAGSKLIEAGFEIGLCVANEGFPDRLYQADGTLMPRKVEGSVITDSKKVAEQAVRLATRGIEYDVNGDKKNIPIDTICIHGDNPAAVQIARAICQHLSEAQIELRHL